MIHALLTRGVEIKEERFGPEYGQANLDKATAFLRGMITIAMLETPAG